MNFRCNTSIVKLIFNFNYTKGQKPNYLVVFENIIRFLTMILSITYILITNPNTLSITLLELDFIKSSTRFFVWSKALQSNKTPLDTLIQVCLLGHFGKLLNAHLFLLGIPSKILTCPSTLLPLSYQNSVFPSSPSSSTTRIYSLCKPTTNPSICYKTILQVVVGQRPASTTTRPARQRSSWHKNMCR